MKITFWIFICSSFTMNLFSTSWPFRKYWRFGQWSLSRSRSFICIKIVLHSISGSKSSLFNRNNDFDFINHYHFMPYLLIWYITLSIVLHRSWSFFFSLLLTITFDEFCLFKIVSRSNVDEPLGSNKLLNFFFCDEHVLWIWLLD